MALQRHINTYICVYYYHHAAIFNDLERGRMEAKSAHSRDWNDNMACAVRCMIRGKQDASTPSGVLRSLNEATFAYYPYT